MSKKKIVKKKLSKIKMKKVKKCRICNSEKNFRVLNLKKTPLEDQFLNFKNKHLKQKTYPLQLNLCKDCGYLFLPHVLSPEASYKYYLYNTEVTLGLKDHYRSYADETKKLLGNSKNNLCLDIGSNDGTLLSEFKFKKFDVIGIEPAKLIAKKAEKKGIRTINSFFNENAAKKVIKLKKKPDVICANYVFANIDNIRQSTKIIKNLLSEKGLFIIETGYHPEQFKKKNV